MVRLYINVVITKQFVRVFLLVTVGIKNVIKTNKCYQSSLRFNWRKGAIE